MRKEMEAKYLRWGFKKMIVLLAKIK